MQSGKTFKRPNKQQGAESSSEECRGGSVLQPCCNKAHWKCDGMGDSLCRGWCPKAGVGGRSRGRRMAGGSIEWRPGNTNETMDTVAPDGREREETCTCPGCGCILRHSTVPLEWRLLAEVWRNRHLRHNFQAERKGYWGNVRCSFVCHFAGPCAVEWYGYVKQWRNNC